MTKVLQRFQEGGDPFPPGVLDAPALPIPETDAGMQMLIPLIRPAVEAMHHGAEARGVALSLPQIGVSLAAFVYCPTGRRGDESIIVNPSWARISKASLHDELEAGEEACLSVRDGTRSIPVLRAPGIHATWTAVTKWWSGRPVFAPGMRGEFFGFQARVWQHACDHLDGKIFGGCRVAAHFSGGCRRV